MKRLSLAAAIISLFLASPALALADTPTPSPTPTPPGFNSNSNFASHVDNNAALPWPLPVLPTFPAPSVTPTLYAATPPHATDYAGQVATATSQIGSFVGPANQLQTPVARVSTLAPAVSGGDVDTGLNVDGSGTVTFNDLITLMGTQFGDFFDNVRAGLESLASMATSFPFLTPIIVAVVVGFAVSLVLRLAGMIIKAGITLYNFVKGILTFVGIWKPG